jgi:hypothetical protein
MFRKLLFGPPGFRPDTDFMNGFLIVSTDFSPKLAFLLMNLVIQLTMQVPKPAAMQTNHSCQIWGCTCQE